MRRTIIGLVIAAITALIPALAMAANQEVAEQIASNLRQSGQLQDYKIGVKYQDGTAWLRGQVADQKQVNAVLKVVFKTPGVTRVVNNMTVGSNPASLASQRPVGMPTKAMPGKPLRQVDTTSNPDQFRTASASIRTTQSNQGGRQTHAARRLDQVLARAASKLLKPSNSAQRVPTSFTPKAAEPVAALAPQQPKMAPQQVQPRLAQPQPRMMPQQMMIPRQQMPQQAQTTRSMMGRRRPVPVAYTQAGPRVANQAMPGQPVPAYVAQAGGAPPVRYDQPNMPNYAWPGYAAYPNYAALTYPKQYSPTAFPYIGPFYPYPQVPLGWRKVTLEWDDGWWMLDFKD